MIEVRADVARELCGRYWQEEREKMIQFVNEQKYFEKILALAKEGDIEFGIEVPRLWAEEAMNYFHDLGYKILDENYYTEKDETEWCQFYVNWE